MNNLLQKIILSIGSLVFASAAMAQTPKSTPPASQTIYPTGFYIGLHSGITSFKNSHTSGPLGLLDFSIGYDKGFIIGGFAGYDFGKFFRAELELTYKQAEIDSLKTSILGLPISLPVQGKIKNLNFMANGYFEYPVNDLITPYVGFGLGMSNIRGTGLTLNLPFVGKRNVKDTVFAYQLIAGVGFNVTDRMTVGVDYRFFDSLKGDFELKNVILGFDVPFKAKLRSHNFMVNLRYRF